ncbi:MAG: hypothetical protein ABI238_01080 [Terrimesophilobacter sp.]
MSAVPTRTGYWPVQLARAVPAIVIGLVVTFSADHSAKFGLFVFGTFAVLTGIVIGWGSLQLDDRLLRVTVQVQAVVAVASGVAALLLNGTGLGSLFVILITFAAVTGILELYLGLRSRGRLAISRDWITVGALTALFALAVLLVPADYAVPWAVEDKGTTASGILTAQIIVVGIFGAYAILLGVYLVIGGLSARWAIRDESANITPATGH